jgi:hypothetical protein
MKSAAPSGGKPPSPLSILMDTVPNEGNVCSISDPCYVAAVKYRLERKQIIKACISVLRGYCCTEKDASLS